METLSKEQKNKIIKELKNRGANRACPMCGNKHFTIVPAYFVDTLQSSLNNLSLGGKSIPSIPIVCTNCGFISQYAIGILGLMPKETPKEQKK